MSEAIRRGNYDERAIRATAATDTGEIWQMPDGRAGYADQLEDGAANDRINFRTEGIVRLPKTNGPILLDGQEVYWDHSANSVTYAPADDRDFFCGTVVGDAAETATTCHVNLNQRAHYTIDLFRDGFTTVVVGTQAVGGLTEPRPAGGGYRFEIDATNEAQKVDALGVNGFDLAANWIVEGSFRIVDDGGAGAQDFTIGIASGTHATDFQSVTSFVALHFDGDSTNINAQSDDNTTDVAPTDTTTDYTMGSTRASRVFFQMDGRDPADVQIYINGDLVLSGSTFTAGSSGTHYPIVHLEKTATTDTYEAIVDSLRVRLMQDDRNQLVGS